MFRYPWIISILILLLFFSCASISDKGEMLSHDITIVGKIRFENFSPVSSEFKDADGTFSLAAFHAAYTYINPEFTPTDVVFPVRNNDYFSVSYSWSTLRLRSLVLKQNNPTKEIIFNLGVHLKTDDNVVYIGDIVFSIKGEDMFVRIEDNTKKAADYLTSQKGPNAAAGMTTRLLEGDTLAEPQTSEKKAGTETDFSPSL